MVARNIRYIQGLHPPLRCKVRQHPHCFRKSPHVLCEYGVCSSRSKVFKVLVILLGHLVRVRGALAVVLGVAVEALGIAGVAHGGDDGPPAAAVVDVIPIGVAEEGVLLDALGAAADVAEAPGAVGGAEGADYVLGFVGYAGFDGEEDGFLDDSGMSLLVCCRKYLKREGWGKEGRGGRSNGSLFVDLNGVLVPEWRVACQELIDEDPQSPPVDGRGVTLVVDDLWREILWRPAERVRLDRPVPLIPQALREPKVHELDMAIRVDQ